MCFILFIDITSFYLLFHLGLISSLAFVDWYFSSNLRKITAIISSNITYLLYYPSFHPAAAAAKSLQSCPTLCDPIDGSPPGFPIPGILQARTLEWVAISFSNAWKWKVKVKMLSCIRLLATPWTAAYLILSPSAFPIVQAIKKKNKKKKPKKKTPFIFFPFHALVCVSSFNLFSMYFNSLF